MTTEWKELKTLEEVGAAQAAGMEIEVFTSDWFPWSGISWNSNLHFRARLRKPELLSEWRELNGIKAVAAAVTAGMEIECANSDDHWHPWLGTAWECQKLYRARYLKPEMKKVKSLCWRVNSDGKLMWIDERTTPPSFGWSRFPAGDIEGEVEA